MRTRSRLSCLAAALAIVAAAPSASAQVVDSLAVEIVAFPDAVILEGPPRVSTSSQVTYRLSVEPPGAAAHIIWGLVDAVSGEPADSSLAYFVEWTDSTATVQIGDAPGLFEVRAEAVPLDSLVIGMMNENQTEVDFEDPFRLVVGETRQLCAYGFSGGRALWVTNGASCHSAPWPTAAGTGVHQRIAPIRRDVPLSPGTPQPTPVQRAESALRALRATRGLG